MADKLARSAVGGSGAECIGRDNKIQVKERLTTMDVKVLEAQQWVNATYGDVPGYVRAPENGKTGWPTMYVLTHALQHELGITMLSDNFGPATLAALAAHGDINSEERNTNIVKIIQCACYCKGYEPGG